MADDPGPPQEEKRPDTAQADVRMMEYVAPADPAKKHERTDGPEDFVRVCFVTMAGRRRKDHDLMTAADELLCRARVLRQDGVGVVGAVVVDVADGFVDRIHHLYADDETQVLRVPVFFARRLRRGV